MRKFVIYASSVALLAVLISCSGYQQEAKRYQVEKAFYDAEKMVQNYGVKPELRSAQDYAKLVTGYREVFSLFISLFPNLTSNVNLSRPEMEAAFLGGQSLMTAADLFMRSEQGDSAMAILQFMNTLSYLAPRHKNEALLMMGTIQEGKGDWEDAEGAYMKLLDAYFPPVINGKFPALDVISIPKSIVEHYASLGDSTTAIKKSDWAIKYYQRILDTLPSTPVSLSATRYLAECYNYQGQYQRSVTLLETVKDSTGRIVDAARGMIADLYFGRLDRKDEALNMYQDIVSQGNDSQVIANTYLKLATVEFKNKHYDQGRGYLQKLTDGFPRAMSMLVQAQRMRAQSFEEENQYDRAKQEYVSLINQFPQTQEAMDALSYMPEFYKKINEPVLAQQWVTKSEEKFQEIMRSSPNQRTVLMASTYLAAFYTRNQMYDQAISQYRSVREQFPKSGQAADALLRIGIIYEGFKKDKLKAIDAYDEFLKQYPSSGVRQKVEEEIKKLQRS